MKPWDFPESVILYNGSLLNLPSLQVYKMHPDAITPTKAHSDDAGYDLYSVEDVFIPLGSTKTIKLGLAINIPVGYVGKIEDRSGMAAKGLRTGGGVIDSGYNGEISGLIHNLTCELDRDSVLLTKGYKIKKGDKISQLLIYKVETVNIQEVDQLWDSPRGNKGFSSSGR